jgi:hypothetical protein
MHTPLFLYVFLSRHPIDGSTPRAGWLPRADAMGLSMPR